MTGLQRGLRATVATALAVSMIWLASCTENATPVQETALPVGPAAESRILLSTACNHTNSGTYIGPVTAKCTELFGNSTTITMPLPPTTPVPVQFSCVGWGHPPAPYNQAEWYAALVGNPFETGTNYASYVSIANTGNYTFTVTPKHPTYAALSPALRVNCQVDPNTPGANSASINITIDGAVPVALTSIVVNPSMLFMRPPSTITGTPDYYDNYNGKNLMQPPATTWTSTNPAVASVNSSGVATPLTRGTFAIRATVGSITDDTPTLTVLGCTALSLTPSTTQNLTAGGNAVVTANATCDAGVNVSTEPVTWSTTNGSVATVSGSGSGNRTGTIHAVAAGNATVKACLVTGPLPVGGICSTPVNVSVISLASISSLTTSPTPAKQYTPFTLTLNGSFDPNTVEMIYAQPCLPAGSWCDAPVFQNSSWTTKSATQLTKTSMVFGTAGPIRVRVRNGPTGTLSNMVEFTITTWP